MMLCICLILPSLSRAEIRNYDFTDNFTGDDLITLDNIFWHSYGGGVIYVNGFGSIYFTQPVDVVEFNIASTLPGWYSAYGSITINAYNNNYTQPIYTETLSIQNNYYYNDMVIITIDTINKIDSLEFTSSGTNVLPTIDNLVIDTDPASSISNRHVLSSAGTMVTAKDNSMTLKFTLGQPTPVSAPLTPTPDDGSRLRPGFWYKSPSGSGFPYDLDADSDLDIDGKDLAAFAASFDPAKLETIANNFGK